MSKADAQHEIGKLYQLAWYSTSTVQIFARQILVHLAELNQRPNGPSAVEHRESIANLQALLVIASAEADKAVEAFVSSTEPRE